MFTIARKIIAQFDYAIDLCLHFVRMDHGAEVANTVARRMVVPAHRDGGQAQYVEAPVPAHPARDDEVSATLRPGDTIMVSERWF